MKSLFIVSSGLAGLLLMGPMVTGATAITLTGTWEGKATCGGVVQGEGKNLFGVPITLKISQDATDVNAEITLDPFDPGVANSNPGAGNSLGAFMDGTHLYFGETKGNITNKKTVALITQCGTTFSGKPHKGSYTGVEGKIKATSKPPGSPPLLEGNLKSLNEDDNTATVCVFDGLVQTDTTDPVIGDCP